MKHNEIFNIICQIAAQEASRSALLGWQSEDLETKQMAAPLREVVNRLLPEPANDAEVILNTLFTAEALAFLKTCENFMIFWNVVRYACIGAQRMSKPMPLDLYMVSSAHVHWVESTMVVYQATQRNLPAHA